ncbi:trypsin-like peptidase domain-containing protein [Streptomyces griseiscabiei]|uniref:Trypsin-like peptidase domain-containing protein n=1 Tax=Streptomyces griseiscabiei TaxID=2993540 RepID=A0ABU4L6Y9_9ACTN|nr:trypsin-like peptidase domain-containing protein [Streptomyces griseiscabiei]MBZ3906478.1 trypsin-like peptidase domain-containing protein [Streptomyces griseiscabiei]MDX2911474.1 trypsin-like peptidase domain-containing protein [Streptomyces griseiscabiei]
MIPPGPASVDHRTDPRVVEVYSRRPEGRGSGTGYLLDGGLVLTAGHVVSRGDPTQAEVTVRLPGSRDYLPCDVEWYRYEADEPTDTRMDAAVLRISPSATVPPQDGLPPLRWGRLVTGLPEVSADLVGYPSGMGVRRDDATGRLVLRDTVRVRGTVNAGTAVKARRYHIVLAQPIPYSPAAAVSRWEGASGAALLSHDLLCGVVVMAKDEPGHGRARAIPAEELLADPGFRALFPHAVTEPAELQPLLEREPSRPANTPVSLLRPEATVVPFTGREDVLARLGAWCEQPGRFSVRLVTGPGGQGKTRLAAELVRRLRLRNWSAGFLAAAAAPDLLPLATETRTPLLLVVDYAETRVEQLQTLLDLVDRYEHSGTTALRLLLLARDKEAGDWWENLCSEALPLRDPPPGTEMELLDLYGDGTEPLDDTAFREIGENLAAALTGLPGVTAPVDPAVLRTLVVPDLSDPRHHRALDLHMAALVALLQALDPEDGPADEPYEGVLLRHEQKIWRHTAHSHGLGALTLSARRELVAAATLCGSPADRDEARNILARLSTLTPGTPDVTDTGTPPGPVGPAADWLATLYPDPNTFWGPLRPDRIGEHLVGLAVGHRPELLDELLATAPPAQATDALRVAARAAPRHDRLGGPLHSVVVRHPQRLAGPAVTAATSGGPEPGPLHTALAEVLRDHPDDGTLLRTMFTRLPAHSRNLSEWGAELAGTLVTLAGETLGEQPDHTAWARLAAAFNDHAHWLTAVRMHDEALERGAMAVRLYEGIAGREPGRYAHDLATAHEGYAHQLHLQSRRQDALASAERAVALRRELADGPVSRAALAVALTGYAHHLSSLGQVVDAAEASAESVAIYAELPARTVSAHEDENAAALLAQAVCLAELAEYDAAIDAVDRAVVHYRRLASRYPDAHVRPLAAALATRADLLVDTGSYERALHDAGEAHRAYEGLATGPADPYAGDRAATLHCLARCLGPLGRWEEAEQRSREAVELYGALRPAAPRTHGFAWARAADGWAVALSECGHDRQAVEVGRGAVDALEDLHAHGGPGTRSALADASRNHAAVLLEQGRAAEAEPFAARSLALRRELATDDAGAFAYEEVEALLLHGMVLAALRPRESVRPLLEGLGRAQEAEDRETGLRLAAALVDAYQADPTVADLVRELTGGVPDWLRDHRG